MEYKYWEQDGLIEETIEEFIIEFGVDSDDSEEESDISDSEHDHSLTSTLTQQSQSTTTTTSRNIPFLVSTVCAQPLYIYIYRMSPPGPGVVPV